MAWVPDRNDITLIYGSLDGISDIEISMFDFAPDKSVSRYVKNILLVSRNLLEQKVSSYVFGPNKDLGSLVIAQSKGQGFPDSSQDWVYGNDHR